MFLLVSLLQASKVVRTTAQFQLTKAMTDPAGRKDNLLAESMTDLDPRPSETGGYPGPVPFYRDSVVPRLVLLACGTKGLQPLRARTADGLSGTVLELGFGSGLNLPHYPAPVTRILGVEPSATAWRLAGQRISASAASVEQVGLDAGSVPLPDASCDSALCTFTLCTVPEVSAALAEVHRIVKPGGRFHLLEHGRAPDPRVVANQRRFEPFQRRIADGCHLTRDPLSLVSEAGFDVVDVEQFYGAGPKTFSYFTRAATIRRAE